MFEVLQKWRDAREQLTVAMQAYSDSITALDSTFRVDSKTMDARSLDKLALEAQEDSELVERGLRILSEARASLNTIRNKSPTYVPFSKLPREILLEIFQSCTHEDPKYYHNPYLCCGQHFSFLGLVTLTHVCASWRNTLVTTPSLWSYIDMTHALESEEPDNPLECMNMSLQRARDFPICLDIDFSPFEAFHKTTALLASDLFLPYLETLQIKCVYLVNSLERDELDAVVSRIFRAARPGSIQSLAFWRDDEHADTSYGLSPFGQDQEDNLQQSLRALRLNNTVLPWQSITYRNLAHLHIGGFYEGPGPDEIPKIDELLFVLSSCRGLQTLQLRGLAIRPSVALHPPQPVVLEHLKVLDLKYMPGDSVALLLPLLEIPASGALSLRVPLYDLSPNDSPSTHPIFALQSFFARTNVTTLYALPDELGRAREESLQKHLAVAPNIATLIIDFHGSKGDKYLKAVVASPVALCPALRSLNLGDTTFMDATLYELVEALPSLKALRLTGTSVLGQPVEEVTAQLKSLGLDTVEFSRSQSIFEDYAWYTIS